MFFFGSLVATKSDRCFLLDLQSPKTRPDGALSKSCAATLQRSLRLALRAGCETQEGHEQSGSGDAQPEPEHFS